VTIDRSRLCQSGFGWLDWFVRYVLVVIDIVVL